MKKIVPKGAERMLVEMGLSPTTVPRVLYNNQVPSITQQKTFRQIEDFLLEESLVTNVELSQDHLSPGGWKVLQISDKGYALVEKGESITQMIFKRWKERNNFHIDERKKEKSELELDTMPPIWWTSGYGKIFNDIFDPEYEKPVWWAKYRLRRKHELWRKDSVFPEKKWEKLVDFIFVNTSSYFQIFILSLIAYFLHYILKGI